MTSDNPHSEDEGPSLSAQVDRICDQFEAEWKSGSAPSIEVFAQGFPDDLADGLILRLLEIDLEYRLSHQADPPNPEEYAGRFPEHAALIRSNFNRLLRTVLAKRTGDSWELASDADDAPTLPPDPPSLGPDAVGGTERHRIPRHLGRYRIIRQLGRGGMGTVLLAHDEQLDRQVALKIPSGHLRDDDRLRKRFQREARAAASLHHPNICPIYDISEVDGIPFICMGYIEGTSLARYVSPKTELSEQRIVRLLLKMVHAVAAAHAAGFIHRDLKPGNVMMDEEDEPIILDFGLARRVDRRDDLRLTQTGESLGTPAYMSPEQVEGDNARIGPATDIYSMGIILYELLTGRLPFQGSVASVMGQILLKEPDKPSQFRKNLTVRLEQVCLCMIAKDPERRYPSMEAVGLALQEYLDKDDEQAQRRVTELTDPGASKRLGVRRSTEGLQEKSSAPATQLPVERKPTYIDRIRGGPQWLIATCGILVCCGAAILWSEMFRISDVADNPRGTRVTDNRQRETMMEEASVAGTFDAPPRPSDPETLSPVTGGESMTHILTSDQYEWTEPVSIDVLNTPQFDGTPWVSDDGLTILFVSNRPRGQGDMDIWQSTRRSTDAEWSIPVNPGAPVNTFVSEGFPALSESGRSLVFNRTRKAVRDDDLFMASRLSADGSWGEPFNLGEMINTPMGENYSRLLDDGKALVFASNRNGDVWKFYYSLRPSRDAEWTEPQLLTGTSPVLASGPSYDSGRLLHWVGAGMGLALLKWDSQVETWVPDHVFGPPVNIDTQECWPVLHRSTGTLYFSAKNRPGGKGGHDIWMARRVKKQRLENNQTP